MDNTNGNLSSAYTGIPYKNVQPYNTNSGLNTTSTTVPSVGADFKELINTASSSQAGAKELIEDYKKKIADIDKNIATLTAEKNKIKANDFSDEERRMIESYTTLGDLDAGVKQIMTSRQFKSALDQTKSNEDKYNQEAKDEKTLAYKNAVNDVAAFVVDNTEAATGKMPDTAKAKYGIKITSLHDAAAAAGIENVDANKAVEAKIVEARNAAGGAASTDVVAPGAGGNDTAKEVNDIMKKYNDLRNDVKTNPFKKEDLKTKRPKNVQDAINALSAELSRINSLDISSDDKIKYEGLIKEMTDALVVYRNAAKKQQGSNNAATGWAAHVKTAKKNAATLTAPKFKAWLASETDKAAITTRAHLNNGKGVSAEDVQAADDNKLLDYRDQINNIVVTE